MMARSSQRPTGVNAHRRPGFTLIETLTVMAALGLLVEVLAVVLVGALRLEKASARALDRMSTRRDLADQFRADVAQADQAPEQWQDEAAGPTCLILARGRDRHVVYRCAEGRLLRTETVGGAAHRREVAPGDRAAVEFERSGAGGRLLTLRLFLLNEDGTRQQAARITAALGGDVQ